MYSIKAASQATGLTVEMGFLAVLLGLAFRSLFVAAVAVLPGLFPIVIAGAVLWWFGEGLQFASVVALTPQASASSTLAPAATSSLADSRSPTRAANSSAVSLPAGIDRLYGR